METITTDEYYAVRGTIDGKQQYVDPDGYLYDYPTPLANCCFRNAKMQKECWIITYLIAIRKLSLR